MERSRGSSSLLPPPVVPSQQGGLTADSDDQIAPASPRVNSKSSKFKELGTLMYGDLVQGMDFNMDQDIFCFGGSNKTPEGV